jgi:hypothetical protein
MKNKSLFNRVSFMFEKSYNKTTRNIVLLLINFLSINLNSTDEENILIPSKTPKHKFIKKNSKKYKELFKIRSMILNKSRIYNSMEIENMTMEIENMPMEMEEYISIEGEKINIQKLKKFIDLIKYIHLHSRYEYKEIYNKDYNNIKDFIEPILEKINKKMKISFISNNFDERFIYNILNQIIKDINAILLEAQEKIRETDRFFTEKEFENIIKECILQNKHLTSQELIMYYICNNKIFLEKILKKNNQLKEYKNTIKSKFTENTITISKLALLFYEVNYKNIEEKQNEKNINAILQDEDTINMLYTLFPPGDYIRNKIDKYGIISFMEYINSIILTKTEVIYYKLGKTNFSMNVNEIYFEMLYELQSVTMNENLKLLIISFLKKNKIQYATFNENNFKKEPLIDSLSHYNLMIIKLFNSLDGKNSEEISEAINKFIENNINETNQKDKNQKFTFDKYLKNNYPSLEFEQDFKTAVCNFLRNLYLELQEIFIIIYNTIPQDTLLNIEEVTKIIKTIIFNNNKLLINFIDIDQLRENYIFKNNEKYWSYKAEEIKKDNKEMSLEQKEESIVKKLFENLNKNFEIARLFINVELEKNEKNNLKKNQESILNWLANLCFMNNKEFNTYIKTEIFNNEIVEYFYPKKMIKSEMIHQTIEEIKIFRTDINIILKNINTYIEQNKILQIICEINPLINEIVEEHSYYIVNKIINILKQKINNINQIEQYPNSTNNIYIEKEEAYMIITNEQAQLFQTKEPLEEENDIQKNYVSEEELSLIDIESYDSKSEESKKTEKSIDEDQESIEKENYIKNINKIFNESIFCLNNKSHMIFLRKEIFNYTTNILKQFNQYKDGYIDRNTYTTNIDREHEKHIYQIENLKEQDIKQQEYIEKINNNYYEYIHILLNKEI